MDHDAGMTPKQPPSCAPLHRRRARAGRERRPRSGATRARRRAPRGGPGRAARSAPRGRRPASTATRRRSRPAGTGENVVISTGTASGKSLCYQLAALEAFDAEPQARPSSSSPPRLSPRTRRASSPAAASPASSRRSTTATRPRTSGPPAAHRDDPPQQPRHAPRRHPAGHERWAEFLHHLRYVVLDEAHVYRGVFGSHVAQVVRRLRRLCRQYGADPRSSSPRRLSPTRAFAERLVGPPFSSSTRTRRRVRSGRRALEPAARGPRRGPPTSALAEASYVTAECVLAGARVIAFAPTRKAAELSTGTSAAPRGPRPRARPTRQPYRAGYTPEQRRDIERRLFAHELDAVVATQALELGIDVGSLDVSLVTGFPARSRACASAGGGPAGPDTATPCWWPARTRSTSTSCASPTAFWGAASRRRSSTCTTRTSAARISRRRRTSGR